VTVMLEYHDIGGADVPGKVTKSKKLESCPNVLVRRIEGEYNSSDSRGMFHRFLPADEEGVEYKMSRH
jgi:hypothetical protein